MTIHSELAQSSQLCFAGCCRSQRLDCFRYRFAEIGFDAAREKDDFNVEGRNAVDGLGDIPEFEVRIALDVHRPIGWTFENLQAEDFGEVRAIDHLSAYLQATFRTITLRTRIRSGMMPAAEISLTSGRTVRIANPWVYLRSVAQQTTNTAHISARACTRMSICRFRLIRPAAEKVLAQICLGLRRGVTLSGEPASGRRRAGRVAPASIDCQRPLVFPRAV